MGFKIRRLAEERLKDLKFFILFVIFLFGVNLFFVNVFAQEPPKVEWEKTL